MNDGNGNDTSWVERSIIGGIPGQFLEKVSTCTFVPDSPAMYLGNDDEGGKIASEVEQSISHVGWGGNHHCENFGVGY